MFYIRERKMERQDKVIAEVLLATYNGEKYICEQIDSILGQTNMNWHLTISDDGSSDNTTSMIDSYVCKYPDRIKRYISGKQFGNARDHFFHLMKTCSAEYMFFCDQDDRWNPEKLGMMLSAMQQAEKVYGKEMPLLVFSDMRPTDAYLNPLSHSLMRYQNQYFEEFDYRSILMQNVVTGAAMCLNRALADLASKCENSSQTIMHDWWVAAVSARFGKIVYIDEPLGDYRQHGNNSVGAKDVRSITHIAYKLAHLNEIRKAMIAKKMQANVFLDTYKDMLSSEDKVFLSDFAKNRSGPGFYWKNRQWIHGFLRLAGMMTLG